MDRLGEPIFDDRFGSSLYREYFDTVPVLRFSLKLPEELFLSFLSTEKDLEEEFIFNFILDDILE